MVEHVEEFDAEIDRDGFAVEGEAEAFGGGDIGVGEGRAGDGIATEIALGSPVTGLAGAPGARSGRWAMLPAV